MLARDAKTPVKRKTILDHKYEIIAPVGLGDMASVWKAKVRGAAGFRRTVAVKRILPQFREDEKYVEMFVEEARMGADLSHQNIVQVYDFCGSAEHGYFLVMEWVEGCSLAALIAAAAAKGARTPWEELTFAVAAALNGLADAHERTDEAGKPTPIIHRDICPENILMSVRGEVKLSDFGLAKATDRLATETARGVMKGKLSYAAPELLTASEPNELTDVYAMGVVLWEALAGRSLFGGAKQIDVFHSILNEGPTPITQVRDDLPAALVDTLGRALSRDPAARPPTAWDFADELFALLKNDAAPYLKPRLGARVRDFRSAND